MGIIIRGDMMNSQIPIVSLSLMIMLAACGGGGGGSGGGTQTNSDIPIALSVENEPLSAGVPKGFVYTLPAPSEPYTDISIDLAETLEAAQISVTPSQ